MAARHSRHGRLNGAATLVGLLVLAGLSTAAATEPPPPPLSPDAGATISPLPDHRGARWPTRDEAADDRRRQELQPLGLPIGGFLAYPRLEVEERVDDNLFRSQSGAQADLISRVLPRVYVQSTWPRHALALEAKADIGRHLDHGGEDYEDAWLGAAGRLDLGDGGLTPGVEFKRLHEDRSSPDDALGAEPTVLRVATARVEAVQYLGRISALLGGHVDRLDYDDVAAGAGPGTAINHDDRDRVGIAARARGGYRPMPAHEFFVQASLERQSYDAALDDFGFDRDSQGYQVVAGLSYDAGGLFTGELYLGYMARDFDDAALERVAGPAYGAEIVWSVTPMTTLAASLGRGLAETTLRGASAVLADRAGLALEHELLRSLLIGLDAELARNDYRGIGREDLVWRLNAEARYILQRHVYLAAGYGYRHRESNAGGADFSENVGLLRLGARY